MPTPEKLVDIPYPVYGIDVAVNEWEQRTGTTPVGVNVRAVDAIDQRLRGGSRPGLDRYINERVNGVAAIQHLAVIVSTSGEALGWTDTTTGDFGGDPGGGGIDFGPDGSSYLDGTPGGGGYQPLGSFQDENNPNQLYYITLTPSSQSGPANGVTTRRLTATTYQKSDNSPVGGINTHLRTSPGGRDGDNDSVATAITVGTADYDVTNNRVETVFYIATATPIAGLGSIRSRVCRIRWTPFKLTEVTSASTASTGQVVIITGTLTDENGKPVEGRTIRLTATGSGTGNGQTAITDANGQVQFSVTDDVPETVTYSMEELSEQVVNETQDVTVTYGGGGIQFVQGDSNNGIFANGILLEFGDFVTAGNLLVMRVLWVGDYTDAYPTTPATITDDMGNTYTMAASAQLQPHPATDYRMHLALYYCANCLGGEFEVTVTGAYQAGYNVTLAVAEYSGVNTTAPLHNTSTGSGTTASVDTGSVTINASGDLIVGIMGYVLAEIALTNDDFTARMTILGIDFLGFADWTAATAAASCTWTLSNEISPAGFGWTAVGASFKKA